MEKYLKCEKCGAIVKVIVPCNCGDCGIKCCGEQMKEYTPTEEEKKVVGKVVTCESCKAQVEVIVPCNCGDCGIRCCGKQMK